MDAGTYFVFWEFLILGCILLAVMGLIVINFWKPICNFVLYWIVPEKFVIKGELVAVFTLNSMTNYFFIGTDDMILRADQSMWIPIYLYYIKVWDPYKNTYMNLELKNRKDYNEMQERLKHLDVSLAIPCKKYAWSDEIEII